MELCCFLVFGGFFFSFTPFILVMVLVDLENLSTVHSVYIGLVPNE